jgi:chemotaxis protein CheC
MSQIKTAPNLKRELLEQFFASATHDASAAMCRWTDGLITLTFDEVREIAVEDAFVELNLSDQPSTMVVLTLEGEVGVRMILMFDDDNARQLAASLLGRSPGGDSQWSPLEKSALLETGNILGCAYMNALVRLIDTEMVPSPPYFIQDYAASVLQQALLAPAMVTDKVLICQTGFRREGKQLDWRVVFIPTAEMRKAMEEAVSS